MILIFFVSKSFQWNIESYKFKNTKFIQSEVADVQNYVQFISNNALVVYMAGSTDQLRLSQTLPMI